MAGLEVDSYARAVRRRWLWVAGAAALGLGVALGVTALRPAVYEARAILLLPSLEPLLTSNSVQILRGISLSEESLARTSRATGVQVEKVRASVSARPDLARNQVTLSAQSPRGEEALRLTQAQLTHLRALSREVGVSIAARQAQALATSVAEYERRLVAKEREFARMQATRSTVTDPSNPATAGRYARLARKAEIELRSIEVRLSELQSRLRQQGLRADLPRALVDTGESRGPMLRAELALENGKRTLGPESPELRRLENEAAGARAAYEREVQVRLREAQSGLNDDLVALVASRDAMREQGRFWRELADRAPEDALLLVSIAGEIEVLQQVLGELTARRDEAEQRARVDGLKWSVLSPPALDPQPVNKDFWLDGLLGLALGAMIGGALVIVREGS